VRPGRSKEKEGGHTSIKIKIRAFVDRGVKKYVVLGIKGVLPRDKLPKSYVEHFPSFWLTKTRKTLKLYDGRTLSIGGIYRKATFDGFIRDIEIAGDRLHALNDRIDDVKAEFEGVRTLKI
jgi:hypothetical protein